MNPDKASPPAWQGMFQWHGADEQAPGWELELELAGNTQGCVMGLAEPVFTLCPTFLPPWAQGQPPSSSGEGFLSPPCPCGHVLGCGTDRQTENLQLPKAKPSWRLGTSSLEPPVSSPSVQHLGWSVLGWEGAAWPWSCG